MFAYIKDRLWNKLNGWKGSLQNSAGKEILIKTVVQAVYYIPCKPFCYQKPPVMSGIKLWQKFGGAKNKASDQFIGFAGRIYVNQRVRVAI